jgi:sugar/nucleoside kinase (ribokinase family)
MRKALRKIANCGRGIVILLDQEGRGNGSAAHIATQQLKRDGMSQDEAYRRIGFPSDNRNYRIVAKVLKYLKIESICLLSSSKRKRKILEKYGVKVEQISARELELTVLGGAAKNILSYKSAGHYVGIASGNLKRKILVIGDLCVDYTLTYSASDADTLDLPRPEVGGTALNATLTFLEKKELFPILFGKVGNDPEGNLILDALNEKNLTALVGRHPSKRTGMSTMLYSMGGGSRIMIKSDTDNANDYSIDDLEQAIVLADLSENDFVFLICHLLIRTDIEHAVNFLDIVSSTHAKVVLDLVPHNIYRSVTQGDFKRFLQSGVFCVISWFETVASLLGVTASKEPSDLEIRNLSTLNSEWLVLRYGEGGVGIEQILRKSQGQFQSISKRDTGYGSLEPHKRKGFGDKLTAEFFSQYLCDTRQKKSPSLVVDQ